MIIPKFDTPEHMGDPYLGAWYEQDAFSTEEAQAVIEEVESSGQVEPIWDLPDSSVNQIFRRLLIDMTREHDFPRVAGLGERLAHHAISKAGVLFPRLHDFRVDEAAIQIYPAGTKLALGWHKDHKADRYMVISAVLGGSGTLSFTEKEPYKDTTEKDVIADIHTKPLGAVFFRAHGLYEREDGTDIRVAHAVTSIDPNEERFTIQYRMGVNAGDYGNTHVNAGRDLLSKS